MHQISSHEAPVEEGGDPADGVMINLQIVHHQGSHL